MAFLLLPAGLAFADTPAALPASPLALVNPTAASANFTWEQLRAGAGVISIVNPSAKDVTATAELPPLHSDLGSGDLFWQQTHFALTIHPGHIERVPLIPAPHQIPAPGGYSGFLTVTASDGKTAPLSIQVHAGGTTALPLVPKLTVMLTRMVPFTPAFCSRRVDIPFSPGAMPPPAEGREIGALTNDTGGTIGVRPDASPENRGRAVILDPPGPSGTYHGDLTFAAGADKGTVTLTAITQDFFLWPAAVVGLGIWLAFLAKRYIGVRRITLVLREQEAELGAQFRKSESEFARQTSGKPFGAYSLETALEHKRADILNSVARIESSKVSSIDDSNQDFKDATAGIQQAAAAIAGWALFGGELNELAQALDKVAKAAKRPNPAPPAGLHLNPRPRFYQSAHGHLVGRPLQSINDLDGLRKDVTTATVLATQWAAALATVEAITFEFNQRTAIPDVTNKLKELWQHLWNVSEQANLDEIAKTGGEADGVRDAVNGLQLPMGAAAPAAAGLLQSARHAVAFATPHAFTTNTKASDERRAEVLRQEIKFGDTASTIFAFVIALLTGLNTYYIGKPFGAVGDYVTVFLWAAATKATLDILAGVLDKFVTPALPKPAPAAPAKAT